MPLTPTTSSEITSNLRIDAARELTFENKVLLDLAAAMSEVSQANAGSTLAQRLSQTMQSDIMIVIYDIDSKHFTLVGDSRGIEPLRRLPMGHPLQQVLAEAVLLSSVPNSDFSKNRADTKTLVQKQFAASQGVEDVSVEIIFDKSLQIQGAVLFISNHSTGLSSAKAPTVPTDRFRSASPALASFFRLHREAEETALQRIKRDIRGWLASQSSYLLLGAFVAFAVLMLIPIPYRVQADCQCNPEVSRMLVAPFDGQLLSAHVKPGDHVAAGDTVAVMDGSQLRAEIASKQALLEQAQQRHSAALAIEDASAVGKELLEAEHLRQQLIVLKKQEQNLILKSPIDGVIISGDLERATGAAMETGRPLFEIAPADSLHAEIAVDESDIRHLETGQAVSLAFHGLFGHRYDATIIRIHPRSEMRNGKNVFITEASFQSDSLGLAPGMLGNARIETGWQCAGWILFHKPYVSWCRFWGWY